jgi:hypothetical protein
MRLLQAGMTPCIALLGLTALAGCGDRVLRPDASLVREVQRECYSDRDWAAALRDNVRHGLVDYDSLRNNHDALSRYCATISVLGPNKNPDQFPGGSQSTAYYINSYNALVLRAVLSRPPETTTMYDYAMPELEFEYQFPLDGQLVTLARIEDMILKSSGGDVRALLATSRAAMGTPRLMNEPIRPETLDRQLAEAAAQALDLPEICRVDHSARTIQVWQLILRRQPEFLAYWKAQRRVGTAFLYQVLLDLASPTKRRALQSAVGYAMREVPFNRSLNRVERLGDRMSPP